MRGENDKIYKIERIENNNNVIISLMKLNSNNLLDKEREHVTYRWSSAEFW